MDFKMNETFTALIWNVKYIAVHKLTNKYITLLKYFTELHKNINDEVLKLLNSTQIEYICGQVEI